MSRLAGKVALVTGASGGLGGETARLFAAEGATVVAADVRSPDVPGPPGVRHVQLDVTDEDQWRDVLADIVSTHGRLDVLINNAGGSLGSQAALADLPLEEYRRVVELNQTSAFLGMRAAVPLMREAGGGAIVNLSSVMGLTATVRMAAYQVAKAAVAHMTKVAAVTYAADGIRVNSVHPGLHRTPATERLADADSAIVVAATPQARWGEPRDVAFGCLYLACDESRFVTGVELVIDGGYLAWGDRTGMPT